ncbi:serine hydrolase [Streptomyces sp. NPDC058052]|uniref:D-alanyl-D-alanine carboxypeptidase n=1 Tax=Streptomyces sp. NPDC058052 TaxID=3346316 RepID=UPI0036E3BEBD
MTHGGGTVAGESPDRAEQQGSSKGKTTAAASTVASPETPASAVSAPDRVDQPTAVFKTLAPRTPEDDAEKPGEKPAEASAEEPAEEPAEDSAEKSAEASSGTAAERSAAPEGDRLKQAVAAWVATAATDGTDDESDADADAESDSDAAAETGDASEASGAREVSGAREASVTAEEPASAPEGPATASGDAEASEDAAEPAEAPATAVEAPKAAEPSWFATKKSAESKPAESKPAESKSAESNAGTAKPGAGSDSDSEPEPESESAAGTGSGAAQASAPKAAAPAPRAEDPVDQPTTMFRAVRPPAAPAVDQPTTALKLPRDPAVSAGSDSDSERTSTFVPLRPDIPADRKPADAAAPEPDPDPKRDPKRDQAAAGKPAASATAAASAAPAAPRTSAPAQAKPAAPALGEPERTRQQPLPPLPPLDLLAELTNTPPPPPNAWRTALRRVRIWTPLVLLLLIVFAIVQMVRPLPAPALKLSASPTYTFAGGPLQMPWPGEGQGAVEVEGVGTIGTYGAQKPAPIASVTKTMTAYVILRDHPIKGKQKGPEITIDKKAAEQAKAAHESTAPVTEGQTYTEKELLQLLMIPSANNVARLLARWDAGSEQAFVDKMNAAAKELGMTQTRYTDPSGLLDSTVSTPKDQLKLAKAVMQYDVFREIVDMPNATIEGVGYIENNNSRLLLKPGVSGIKTGSSTPAGGNLLWSANTVVDGEPRRVLGIVMGAQNAETLNKKLELSLDYSYELIKKAQDDVTSAAVVKKGQVVGYVDDGLGGRTPVVATKEIKAVGWPGLKVALTLADGGKAVPHTGKAGDVVGTVSIGEGAGKVSAPVALESDLVEPGFDKKLTRVG